MGHSKLVGRVLVVDDIPETIRVLRNVLQEDHQVVFALDGSSALRMAKEDSPDIILLDAIMPGMDGFSVCAALKGDPETADIPIIFVTSIDRPEDEARAFDYGAVDFITKPISPAVVRARVRTHLTLSRLYKSVRNTSRTLEVRVAERTQELAQALTEAERARAEAVQANESKSRFLATVSHELRTPLNAIIGFSQMMQEELFGPLGSERYKGYLGDIEFSGQHLLGMVNDLLDLSSIHAGTRSLTLLSTDAWALIDECLRLLDLKARSASITLSVIAPEDRSVLVQADQRSLRQVLLNIVGNAVKFTPSGGRVTVSASVVEDFLRIHVADTGVGIGSNDLSRVCDPFVQVERERGHGYHEGAGLGLPISKALIELHGGTLDIDSELGHGTTVTFSLPVTPRL